MAKTSPHSLFTFLLLCVVAGVAFLWFAGKLTVKDTEGVAQGTSTGLPQTEEEFRKKLAELRMERERRQQSVRRLEDFKAQNIEQLKSKGVSSGDDYLKSDDKEIKLAVVNLKGWVTEINEINKQIVYYDEAISSVETMLDKLERQRVSDSVAMSEEESIELQKVIVDLRERLSVETNVLEDEELGRLLDLEMSGDKN